jgi:ATP-dependent RNA helicase SUPV3L1/SUV3
MPPGFYDVVGYRVCGSRAVRVDMLERLADLIRPRVYWKPEKEGDTRPEGSIEGGGFTVIPDMMSLVGCSGEEFADVLRTLGYRLERRRAEPQAPDTAAAAVAPDAAAPAPEVVAAAVDAPGEVPDLEVWRPKPRNRPTGARSPDQRRSRPGAGDSTEPQRRVRKRKSAKDIKDAEGAKGEHRAGRKQAPDRKQDRGPSPTSPFAALGALKKVLEQNQIAKNRERS